jgi:cytochrome P450
VKERQLMLEFDPFDPAYFADPYPYYEAMRAEHPVYRREVPNHRVWPHYWMISRASDVNESLRDWRTFSSARGTLVDTDITLIPPNIFNMDPPRHDELRGLLARVLTPTRIAGLEPHARRYAESLTAEFGDGFDAAADYAHKIPTVTMCTLMDLPMSERDKFLKWNLDTLGGGDFTSPAALNAYAEMGAYWEDIVAARRRQPGEDLISQILHTEVKGEALSDAEVAGFCSLLHDAAQNTTMNMITHGVLALGRHPDHLRRLRDEPAIWDNALEEILRYVSPVQGLARCTTRDVELHGVTIPAGDQVLVLYGSANHDPDAYPDPEVLDFDRTVKVHWTFGTGIHYCLGNAVARLEVRIALQTLVDLLPGWEVDESGVEYDQLVPTRGVAKAPISTVAA